MDNRNCLTWEECIRLNDVTFPHVLEMQDIILDQEERIAELENILEDNEQLFNSFDFETLEQELDRLNIAYPGLSPVIGITKIINNFKLRIQS